MTTTCGIIELKTTMKCQQQHVLNEVYSDLVQSTCVLEVSQIQQVYEDTHNT